METTIEQQFSEALRWAEREFGKKIGFQAKLSLLTGIKSPNINELLRKDKGVSEPRRRRLFDAAKSLVPALPPGSYDQFIDFGRWLKEGKRAEDWCPSEIISTGNPDQKEVIGGNTVALTPFEYEILQLFRRYGNVAMGESCLAQLRDAERYWEMMDRRIKKQNLKLYQG